MKTTVRFFRHDGICRPMCSCFKSLDRSTAFRPGSAQTIKDAPEVLRPTHRRDEFRPAIPQRVARQQSPPPLHRHAHPKSVLGSGTMNLQRTVNSVLTVCLSPGDHPSQIFGTLIGDEQQIYDLNHLDDQLVLGIKGTLSVVELKVLRQRLQAGQESKALPW
jgi:hypothetical protein